MRFLLTNDDGYDAPGLAALVRALRGLGDCVVVASSRRASGTGHAISQDDPVRIQPADTALGCPRYIVDGWPADCVRVGLTALADRLGSFDWVVAGINRGGNLGMDVYYSGTVAAAREAVILGLPGIAVSQYIRRGVEPDWARAQTWTESLVRQITTTSGQERVVWNVGLPSLDPEQRPSGAVLCPLSTEPLPVRYRLSGTCDKDALLAEYDGVYADRSFSPGTDVARTFDGWITVTKLGLDPSRTQPEIDLTCPE